MDLKTRIRVCLLYEFELGHHAVVAHNNIKRVFGPTALSDYECDELFSCYQSGNKSPFLDYAHPSLSDERTSLADQRFTDIDLSGMDNKTRNEYLAKHVKTKWYYVGQDFKKYGPNSAASMLAWLQGNYFPDNVLLKTEHDDQYYALMDWMSVVNDPRTLFTRNVAGMTTLVNEANKLRTGESPSSGGSLLSQQPLLPAALYGGGGGPNNQQPPGNRYPHHQQGGPTLPIQKPLQQTQAPMLMQQRHQHPFHASFQQPSQQQMALNIGHQPTSGGATATAMGDGKSVGLTMMQPSFAVMTAMPPSAVVNVTLQQQSTAADAPTPPPIMMMRGHFSAPPPSGAVAMYSTQQPPAAYMMAAGGGGLSVGTSTIGFASSPGAYCLATPIGGGYAVGSN